MDKDDVIGVRYGSKIDIPLAYGGGNVDWSSVDASDLESVRANLPPCQVRAELEARLVLAETIETLKEVVRERHDMLIHALVGASGDDIKETLAELTSTQHLASNPELSPSIMRYLNDIARTNAGIGVRMDYESKVANAIREAVQAGGEIDYASAALAGASVKPAREKVLDEDSAYINKEDG